MGPTVIYAQLRSVLRGNIVRIQLRKVCYFISFHQLQIMYGMYLDVILDVKEQGGLGCAAASLMELEAATIASMPPSGDVVLPCRR